MITKKGHSNDRNGVLIFMQSAPQASTPSTLHPTFLDVQSELTRFAKQQEDGVLELATVSGQVFILFFRMGRLVWATDHRCRFRRWNRLLGRFFPALAPQIRRLQAKEGDIFWEYKLLSRLLNQGKLERDLVGSLISENLREVLFDISQSAREILGLKAKSDRHLTIADPISLLSVSELLEDVIQELERWSEAGLQQYSPTWSPVICSYESLQAAVSGKTYQIMTNLLKGELSLRDLALLLPGDLFSVSKTLVQYERGNILKFKTLPDFPPPWPVEPSAASQAQVAARGQGGAPYSAVLPATPPTARPTARLTAPPAAPSNQPLILCVDDSPRSCEELGQIIRESGYQYMSLQDSVQALPTIIERQPALLFIDLVMPIIRQVVK